MTTSEQPRTTGWPSVPKVLVNAIADQFSCYVATRFPVDLSDIVSGGTGVVRVARLGGNRDRLTDTARVAIDVIHASESAAEDLAELIAAWAVDTSPIRAVGLMLDGAALDTAPYPIPYTDPTVSQFSMVLATSSRRRETRR